MYTKKKSIHTNEVFFVKGTTRKVGWKSSCHDENTWELLLGD